MGDLWYGLDDNGDAVPHGDRPRAAGEYADRFDPSLGLRCWRVARTEKVLGTDAYVSTVFLGLDHSFGDDGPPILWETMAFNVPGTESEFADRYTSRVDAVDGHAAVVAEVEHYIRQWQDEQAVLAAREAPQDVRPLRSGLRQIDLED